MSDAAPWADLRILMLWAIAGLLLSATVAASGAGAEIAQALANAG